MFFDDVGDFTLGSIVDVYFVWNFIGYSFLLNGFHREHGSIRPQKKDGNQQSTFIDFDIVWNCTYTLLRNVKVW